MFFRVRHEHHVPLVVVVPRGLRGRHLTATAFERQYAGLQAQREHGRTVNAVHEQTVRVAGLEPQYQVDEVIGDGRVRPPHVAPAAGLERHETGHLQEIIETNTITSFVFFVFGLFIFFLYLPFPDTPR